MKNVFRKLNDNATSGKEQVGDYDFKESYPDVNRSMAWSDLLPYIRQATRTYIIPYIGDTLYDAIADKLQESPLDLTRNEETFASYLCDCIAYYAIMLALPKKKTVIASMGAVENAGSNIQATSQWGFRSTLWSVAQDADRMADEMLTWLEKNADGDDFLEQWLDDDASTFGTSVLVKNRKTFAEYHFLNSRRTFLAMVPTLNLCAERYILPVLCSDQYNLLLEKVKSNDLSDDEKQLLHLVRKVLVKWAVWHSVKTLPVLPDQEGFRLISNADAIDSRSYSSEITTGAIAGISEQAEMSARTGAGDLIEYLYNNADKFPLWKESDCNKMNDADYCKACMPIADFYGAVMI
jgi:hypothetical protein